MEETCIQKFYKNVNVFITGGTGFMGKILVEKLLRSTEVSTLYLLVRDKKGKSLNNRRDEFFDDLMFNRLKEEKPEFQNRVKAVHGDLSLASLGLNTSDKELLILKIDIVIHLAATIKFNENLKTAYNINVNGTKNVMDLAREMKHLKSMVYVSTAYSNYPLKLVEEKIYDPPVSYQDLQIIIEKMSEEEMDALTPKIIGKWPNTYSFTKCIAESLIQDVAGDLPIAIFRPSIVMSTYREPMEGWKNNYFGVCGIYIALQTGLLRVYYGDPNITIDVVPVDTCISALIASAWDVSTTKTNHKSGVQIYNYVSGPENQVTLNEMTLLNLFNSRKYPTIQSMWTPFVLFTSNPYIYWILAFFLHIIPGCVMDFVLLCGGSKPKMLKLYRRVHTGSEVLIPFSFRGWKFSNKNVVNMWQKLDPRDKELFPFSIVDVNWMKYFRTYIKGLRKYVLKDPDRTLVAARRKYIWFSAFNTIGKYIVTVVICDTASRVISWLCASGANFLNVGFVK